MNKKARSALHALRSARANGALDQTEAQFLDLIEGLVPEHSPNDPKLSTPRGPTLPCGGMTVNYAGSAEHWSPWLEWKGGPCPLPPGTSAQIERPDDGVFDVADAAALAGWDWAVGWKRIIRFRYHSIDPAGWLPRRKFIPPAELWDEGCPVRVEWLEAPTGSSWTQVPPSRLDWIGVTHIRLVAREAKAGLPEFAQDEAAIWDVIKGWDISRDGRSYAGATGNDAREIAKAVRAAR